MNSAYPTHLMAHIQNLCSFHIIPVIGLVLFICITVIPEAPALQSALKNWGKRLP